MNKCNKNSVRNRLLATCLLFCVLSASSFAAGKTVTLKPTGEYATINVDSMKETIKILQSGTAAQQKKTIEAIQKNPEQIAPPILYLLSEVLFTQGQKDEAAFWFYAAQLRARYDANRCADISAREAVSVLNHRFGKPINQYMFQDIPKLKKLIPQVIEWDKKTPHTYDHRWINLHGMNAINVTQNPDNPQKPLSLPENQWSGIAEQTRTDYLEGFSKVIKKLKESKN